MTKRPRKKKARNGLSEAEKVVRVVQGLAIAGVAAYRVVKPHLRKLRKKRKEKQQERKTLK